MICPFFATASIYSKQLNINVGCPKTKCAAWGQIGVECVNPEAHYSEHKYEPILGCKLCQPNANGFYGGLNYAYPYNPSYETCCDSNMEVGKGEQDN